MDKGLIGETKAEKQARLQDAQARLADIAPSLAHIYAMLHDGEALDVNVDESASGILDGGKKPLRKLIVMRPGVHYTLTVKTGKVG